ncbi:unnamed protein product, partial [Choristocarpus tenellus]
CALPYNSTASFRRRALHAPSFLTFTCLEYYRRQAMMYDNVDNLTIYPTAVTWDRLTRMTTIIKKVLNSVYHIDCGLVQTTVGAMGNHILYMSISLVERHSCRSYLKSPLLFIDCSLQI